jgi:CheY-like chemotaxis protein
MTSARKQLGDLLVEAGIITTKTLERALERQKGSGKRLGIVLEEMGVLTEEELVTALASQFNFKTVKNFAGHPYPPELLARVPEDMAVTRLVFPLKEREGMLAVAINDPFDTETLDFLAKKNNVKIFPVLSTRDDLLAAVKQHYLRGRETDEKRHTILVVDDTQTVTAIIRAALEKEGFQVITANDGLEGLKLAITHRPDMIICDAIMPRMDGFGLKRAIDANPQTAGIPLILLTSKASGEDEQKALELGFLDFIPKPVLPIRVVSRVKHSLQLIRNMKR